MAIFAVGCAGPEKKLGRGINNFTEFARGGEIRRSVEQTALRDGRLSPIPQASSGASIAACCGLSWARSRLFRSRSRATSPIWPPAVRYPTASVDPVFPDSYTPHLISDTTFEPDAALGFSGGDVAPYIPGQPFPHLDY